MLLQRLQQQQQQPIFARPQRGDHGGRLRRLRAVCAASGSGSRQHHGFGIERVLQTTTSLVLATTLTVQAAVVPLAAAAVDAQLQTPRSVQAGEQLQQQQRQPPPAAAADAPDIHAEGPEQAAAEQAAAEQQQQQAWWQHDAQAWLELSSAAELAAFVQQGGAHPPPAWPALEHAPRLRLVEFYAGWCPACRAAAPGMAEVAADPDLRRHVTFARVNIDRAKAAVRQLGVTRIPTVLLLAPDGSRLDSLPASGPAVRDALTLQLAALGSGQGMMQQQQLTEAAPPGGDAAAQLGPQSEVVGPDSNSSSSSGQADASTACGTTPEPSCGALPPGVVPSPPAALGSSASNPPAQAAEPPAAAFVAGPPNKQQQQQQQLDAAKQRFLAAHGSDYGYSGYLDKHYESEVGRRLGGPDTHYLDYTGAALPPASLLQAVHDDLMSRAYGNPHSAASTAPEPSSSSSSGQAAGAAAPAFQAPAAVSEAALEGARAAVLAHLHADPAQYTVVFTRSATDALRMVGDVFPWTSGQQADSSSSASSSASSSGGSSFIYTRSNHNSVLGIGAQAAAAGARLVPLSDEAMDTLVQQQQLSGRQDPPAAPFYDLVVYPPEDNFSGVLRPLSWVNRLHAASTPQRRLLVLLDAAAFLPTHELDLSAHPADFVVASAYKQFGAPTGLGLLVLRTELVPLLNKTYFGGGSVALATPEDCWHVSKCDPASALADGTQNYLSAAALSLAYENWDARGGVQAVERHTTALASWLFDELLQLRHSNGAPLVRLYGRHSAEVHRQQLQQLQQQPGQVGAAAAAADGFGQGPIFNFSVLQPDGRPVSFSRVDRDAAAAGLFLRSGCVCNPGACYDAVGLSAAEVQSLVGVKEGCGDELDWITVPRPAAGGGAGGGSMVATEVPLGTVRASLGWASRFEDAWALAQFLRQHYQQ